MPWPPQYMFPRYVSSAIRTNPALGGGVGRGARLRVGSRGLGLLEGLDLDRRDRVADPEGEAEREEDDDGDRERDRPVALLEQPEQEPGRDDRRADADQPALRAGRVVHGTPGSRSPRHAVRE